MVHQRSNEAGGAFTVNDVNELIQILVNHIIEKERDGLYLTDAEKKLLKEYRYGS